MRYEAGLFAVAMLAIANKSLAQQLPSFRDEQQRPRDAGAAGHDRRQPINVSRLLARLP